MTPKAINSAPQMPASPAARYEEAARVLRDLHRRTGGGFYFP